MMNMAFYSRVYYIDKSKTGIITPNVKIFKKFKFRKYNMREAQLRSAFILNTKVRILS